jgi:hypothetical protein
VNVCFIVAVGPDAADRAHRHARQKAFRDLERESRIGASVIRVAFSGRPDPASVPGLTEAMTEFTARSDREKGWVDGSIDDRIVAVGDRFGKQTLDQLHLARFMVYRHSSEVLHGTLFGVLYFFGLTQPKESWTQADAAEHIGQQHMMLLMGVGLALEAVVGTFDAAYGFAHAKEQSQRLSHSLITIPFFKAGRHEAEAGGGEPEGVA